MEALDRRARQLSGACDVVEVGAVVADANLDVAHRLVELAQRCELVDQYRIDRGHAIEVRGDVMARDDDVDDTGPAANRLHEGAHRDRWPREPDRTIAERYP